jgi:PIN domain nuclease of toxin-antitoxin system
LKGYLLDTSVALIALSTPEALSSRVRRAIEQGPGFLSVVAYWEVMIKSMRGTLDVGDPRDWFGHALDALGLRTLLYRPEHVAALFSLPPVHQDPFDRALIAQATVEDLTLLTTDATVSKYGSAAFRAIR